MTDGVGGAAGDGASPEPAAIALQPMVHVVDMHRAVVFYEALGGTIIGGNHDGDYVEVEIGGSRVSLLAHPPNPEQGEGAVELQFASPDLDAVWRQVQGRVDVVAAPEDTGFGRQLQLRTPDGVVVKVNQLAPSRFANANGA